MRKKNLKLTYILCVVVYLFLAGSAYAGNFGVGSHAGYGVLKYEENTDVFGQVIESETTLNTVLFGFSGEYSFVKLNNFYTGLVTDFTVGLEGEEEWKEDDVRIQTNDVSVFGQFYDLRFGYKNSLGRLYYRAYLSGGWDGIHFRRKNFTASDGSRAGDVITEDFSLWRTGAGVGSGYKFGKWAADIRAAYSYYFDGDVRNSSHRGLVFDTDGICFDAGIGVMREITGETGLYLGGSYTLIDLNESEVKREITQHGNIISRRDIVFPDSRTQIFTGVVNVTYRF
ncbi:MAG: hypothetical protein HZA16_06410 [Nitrospirae bacterium]|nr:hypothetical protein [Nitrospirota bacterium]